MQQKYCFSNISKPQVKMLEKGVMIPVKQMQTAYWLSQEEMPPIKFTSLCELQVRNCKTMVATKIFDFY